MLKIVCKKGVGGRKEDSHYKTWKKGKGEMPFTDTQTEWNVSKKERCKEGMKEK